MLKTKYGEIIESGLKELKVGTQILEKEPIFLNPA